MNKNKILITGAAGFIGFHLSRILIKNGYSVIGLDNLNDYYNPQLKKDRLKILGVDIDSLNNLDSNKPYLSTSSQFIFYKINLEDRELLPEVFSDNKIDIVVNLAAQAGVRYSIENPEAYIDSNIVGFLNLLECCRNHKIKKLVYASSSSVYGQNKKVPFSTEDNVDHPISIYAATKKSNELMAYTYSHLYDLQTIGLRFFTVYGPWGRPDMAMFLFTDAILNDKPLKIFNNGNLSRDFTYIDDIVEGIFKVIRSENSDQPKYKLYNIGNSKPVKLLNFIEEIEKQLDKTTKKIMLPMQAGDVNQTWANVENLKEDYDYRPSTSIQYGISAFIEWYKSYYKKN